MRAALALLTLAASPAAAQTIAPLAEARLRYEQVTQGGLPDDAHALTARVRAGLQASDGPWSVLAEMQGNLALVGDYYDGLAGPATRPLVADPQNVALYRAQLQYRSAGATITAGRQRITLDDERFVGNAAFRGNAQTFDAVRAELTPVKGMKADLTYAWNVRTIWGIDGAGARPQGVPGDNIFATLGWASPAGTLTGFAYLVDQDAAAVQGYRLSSQTYGVRLAGTRPIGQGKITYQASWARQSDWHRNPNDYVAEYWLADVALDLNGPRIGLGYEALGADRGAALTSFQTPLSSVFKFQGWADKFTATPPDGIRDLPPRAEDGRRSARSRRSACPPSITGLKATGWRAIMATSSICLPRRGSAGRPRASATPPTMPTGCSPTRANSGSNWTGPSDETRTRLPGQRRYTSAFDRHR